MSPARPTPGRCRPNEARAKKGEIAAWPPGTPRLMALVGLLASCLAVPGHGAPPFGSDNPFIPRTDPAATPMSGDNPFVRRAMPASSLAPASPPSAFAPQAMPSACPETLAGLVATWPRYRDPMLSALQDTMKNERIAQAIGQAKAQGKSAREAIRDLERQAGIHDDSARQAARCASQLNATLRSPEAFLRDGRQGAFVSQRCNAGARAACVCQMVQTLLGAEYNRALAEAFACHEREGRW